MLNSIKICRNEPVRKEKLGHRKVDWSQQLDIVVQDIQQADIYKKTPGRTMPGALGYLRRTNFDFKVTTHV